MDKLELDYMNDQIKSRTSQNLCKYKDAWLIEQGLNPRMNYKDLAQLISEKTGRKIREVTLTQYFRGDRFNLGFVLLMAGMMDMNPLRILLTEEDLAAETSRMLRDFTSDVEKAHILDEFRPILDFHDKKFLYMTIRKEYLGQFSIDSKAEIYGLVLEPHVNHTSHRDGSLALVDATNLQITKGSVLIQSSDHWFVCEVVLSNDLTICFKFNDGTYIPYNQNIVKGRVFHVFS